jgi:hypothetical protein
MKVAAYEGQRRIEIQGLQEHQHQLRPHFPGFQVALELLPNRRDVYSLRSGRAAYRIPGPGVV